MLSGLGAPWHPAALASRATPPTGLWPRRLEPPAAVPRIAFIPDSLLPTVSAILEHIIADYNLDKLLNVSLHRLGWQHIPYTTTEKDLTSGLQLANPIGCYDHGVGKFIPDGSRDLHQDVHASFDYIPRADPPHEHQGRARQPRSRRRDGGSFSDTSASDCGFCGDLLSSTAARALAVDASPRKSTSAGKMSVCTHDD